MFAERPVGDYVLNNRHPMIDRERITMQRINLPGYDKGSYPVRLFGRDSFLAFVNELRDRHALEGPAGPNVARRCARGVRRRAFEAYR
jgi:hypothetical protein